MTQNIPQVEKHLAAAMGAWRRFWTQTSGAVTIDWVVLTAAVVAMVVAFMTGFTTDVNDFLVILMASL